jgi:hypothetical protein
MNVRSRRNGSITGRMRDGSKREKECYNRAKFQILHKGILPM